MKYPGYFKFLDNELKHFKFLDNELIISSYNIIVFSFNTYYN